MKHVGSLLVVLAIACGDKPSPSAPAPAAPSGRAVDPGAMLPTTSEDVSLAVGERSIAGTVVAPAAPGPWPAVVLLAGSGPTDRDWKSPLLPGSNGSAKLLAEALAARGAVVIRFDKIGSGTNQPSSVGELTIELTIDTFRDEALAALAAVRARADVRADRVFIAGHSEGGAHATRVAQAAGDQLAGILYLSSLARSMADTVLTQVEHQLRAPIAGLSVKEADAELAALRTAFADFRAGKLVDPRVVTKIPGLQQMLAIFLAPATASLSRELLWFDTAEEGAKLALPALVLGGGKDIQVDVEVDVRPLDRALRSPGRDVTLHLAPDADHVLKHEPRSVPELRANLLAVQGAYNADERQLDDEAVRAIVAWLERHTR